MHANRIASISVDLFEQRMKRFDHGWTRIGTQTNRHKLGEAFLCGSQEARKGMSARSDRETGRSTRVAGPGESRITSLTSHCICRATISAMSDEPRKSRRIVIKIVVALGALLVLYVGEYFWLSKASTSMVLKVTREGAQEIAKPETTRVRTFDSPLLQSAYIPMAWVEANVRKERVALWNNKGGDPVLIDP